MMHDIPMERKLDSLIDVLIFQCVDLSFEEEMVTSNRRIVLSMDACAWPLLLLLLLLLLPLLLPCE